MMAWKRTLAALSLGLGFGLAAGSIAGADSHGVAAAPGEAEVQGGVETALAQGPTIDPEATPDPEARVDSEAAADPEPAALDTGSDPDVLVDSAPVVLEPVAENSLPALGALGYDAEGRPGRIHEVAVGDTLWDISDAYLGTPWVWPSIWNDNGQVENPHVIHPGDRIWITPTEMRRISAAEADALLAGAPAAPVEVFEPMAPAALDPVPETASAATAESRSLHVSGRESTGLITPELMNSAASVVDKVSARLLLSQEDRAYIGLGEGEVSPGDQFSLFRTLEAVEDPDTGELLGYHVDILGWVSVEETYPESSLVQIRMSTGPVEIGDRVMPREPLSPEVEIQASPSGVEGKISFFPQQRVLMGFGDFVYLNRGTLDGLEVGSPLEVFRPGNKALEDARDEYVSVPDRVVANMLVVRAEEESAVAVVTATEGALELGDRFRGEGLTETR